MNVIWQIPLTRLKKKNKVDFKLKIDILSTLLPWLYQLAINSIPRNITSRYFTDEAKCTWKHGTTLNNTYFKTTVYEHSSHVVFKSIQWILLIIHNIWCINSDKFIYSQLTYLFHNDRYETRTPFADNQGVTDRKWWLDELK